MAGSLGRALFVPWHGLDPDVQHLATGKQQLTTVLIRNVPHGVTRDEMLIKGYCFLNFVSEELARSFIGAFNGFSEWPMRSRRVCTVEWSVTQGFNLIADLCRNSRILGDHVPDKFKPVVFVGKTRLPLPIDFRTHDNKGYCFLNFVSEELARSFIGAFNGFTEWPMRSRRVCTVEWSVTQGFNLIVDLCRNSRILGDHVPDKFKPVVFVGKTRLPLPIDFRTHDNKGYCFLNFVSEELARSFIGAFNGFTEWPMRSRRVCTVEWSVTQGFNLIVDLCRNSRILGDHVPDKFKPVVFVGKTRVSFPEPRHGSGSFDTWQCQHTRCGYRFNYVSRPLAQRLRRRARAPSAHGLRACPRLAALVSAVAVQAVARAALLRPTRAYQGMATSSNPALAFSALAGGLKADPRLAAFAQQLQALVPTLQKLAKPATPDVVMVDDEPPGTPADAREREAAAVAQAGSEAQRAVGAATADAAAVRARARQSHAELLRWLEQQRGGQQTHDVAEQQGVKHELVKGIFDQLVEAAKKKEIGAMSKQIDALKSQRSVIVGEVGSLTEKIVQAGKRREDLMQQVAS
ncbi:unnamed protein product, partial [Prorocentrum cordatum]